MSSFHPTAQPAFLGLVLFLGGALAGCGASAKAPEASTPAGSPAEEAPASALGGDKLADAAPAPQPSAPSDGDEGARSGAAQAPGARTRIESERAPREPSARPGLGTSWGETRNSRITTTPFERADAASPFVTASMFYNDSQGARAMAGGGPMLPQRRVDVGDGVVSWGLKDGDSGRFLTGFETAGRDYVVGEAGQRYVIVLQNNSSLRLEVVVSVDGLDVIDGKPAGFGKRGYLVDGHGTLEIDGFRQSEDAVAAFRFGSVRESYAAQKKAEQARNVGVIGVALFHERGSTPSLWRDEVRRRHDADPFPGRFATPPGG